jgi:uncharacterized protein (DUF302 family)
MGTGEINYGEAGEKIASFQRAIITTEPFEKVVAKLRKGIEAAGLWILHEIDPQAVLRRGRHVIGAGRQILFFHPDLMIRLLAADHAALLEVPLKFAVLELADGSVSVRWLDPVVAFGRYRTTSLDKLAAELGDSSDGCRNCGGSSTKLSKRVGPFSIDVCEEGAVAQIRSSIRTRYYSRRNEDGFQESRCLHTGRNDILVGNACNGRRWTDDAAKWLWTRRDHETAGG